MVKKPQSAEINPGPGNRMRNGFDRPPAELVAKYSKFETTDISDMLNRLYTMDPGIKSVGAMPKVVGSACTVKTYPGDNLMVHKSLDVAKPGDVVVVDTSGSNRTAVFGDLVAAKAKHRGIAGFIIDGLIRDIEAVREVGIPVFARGITPFGPLHRGPGELNYSIACGGIVVHPGDIVAADHNGIVVIRSDFAAEVMDRLEQHSESMESYIAAVKRGEFNNDWVDRTLEGISCEVAD